MKARQWMSGIALVAVMALAMACGGNRHMRDAERAEKRKDDEMARQQVLDANETFKRHEDMGGME